jgi:hypothetical protein
MNSKIDNINEIDELKENMQDRLILSRKFLNKNLFSDLILLDTKNTYEMSCIYCRNKNIIMSSKYVLQRCNKCNKEYIPNIKK